MIILSQSFLHEVLDQFASHISLITLFVHRTIKKGGGGDTNIQSKFPPPEFLVTRSNTLHIPTFPFSVLSIRTAEEILISSHYSQNNELPCTQILVRDKKDNTHTRIRTPTHARTHTHTREQRVSEIIALVSNNLPTYTHRQTQAHTHTNLPLPAL